MTAFWSSHCHCELHSRTGFQSLRLTTERRLTASDRNAFELGRDAPRLGLLDR